MAELKQSTGYVRVFDADTGFTPVVFLSKAGGSFSGAAGAVAGVDSATGFFKITLTADDTDTLGDLAYRITDTGGGATRRFVDQVRSAIFSDLSINSSGQAKIASNIKQNDELTGFQFVMTDAGDHAPTAGFTVTAQRSQAGGGFASCDNAVTDVGNGVYSIDLSAADLNTTNVMLRFTATGADDLHIELLTVP